MAGSLSLRLPQLVGTLVEQMNGGGSLITLATKNTGNLFLMRRRACCSDFGIFFATVLGIMHRIAGRVNRSLDNIILKALFKNVSIGNRTHVSPAGIEPRPWDSNPCYNNNGVTGVPAPPRGGLEPATFGSEDRRHIHVNFPLFALKCIAVIHCSPTGKKRKNENKCPTG